MGSESIAHEAAARSPCRCFKTRVLHFRLKNTPLKDKKWKEKVKKNAQLSFCGRREAFHQEILLRGIQSCFLHDGSLVCVEMQPRQWSFCWIFRYIFHSLAKKITFMKANLCIFKCLIDVLLIFFFGAKEKLQNVPRFEMDFALNFAVCSADFTCVNGSTIEIESSELL